MLIDWQEVGFGILVLCNVFGAFLVGYAKAQYDDRLIVPLAPGRRYESVWEWLLRLLGLQLIPKKKTLREAFAEADKVLEVPVPPFYQSHPEPASQMQASAEPAQKPVQINFEME
jgi:hypothetical protein